jgi:hypothetical protein
MRVKSGKVFIQEWSARRDSNAQPSASDAGAPPTELRAGMDTRTGFEPVKDGFADRRNRPLCHRVYRLVVVPGIEPGRSRV